MPRKMNKYMKVVARSYGGGDYAYLADQASVSNEELASVGDTLFKFLMIELSGTEGCSNQTEALRRVDTAISDLSEVRRAMENMDHVEYD